MLSSIKANLLSDDKNLIEKLQRNLRDFYSIKDLRFGYSIFDSKNSRIRETIANKSNSIILTGKKEIRCNSNYFCETINQKVFVAQETFIVSDVEAYGKNTNKNPFYENLQFTQKCYSM